MAGEYLIGRKYNRLEIVDVIGKSSGGRYIVLCKCDCGNMTQANICNLYNGGVKSCGCLVTEHMKKLAKDRIRVNDYRIDGDVAYIKSSNTDDEIVIDAEDLDKVLIKRWLVDNSGYARSFINGDECYMHKLVLGVANNKDINVDHIDCNKLNNRKINLRVCTRDDNSRNRPWVSVGRNGHERTSQYKGISKTKRGKPYVASISVNGKSVTLGRFDNEIDAAIAYDNAALKYYGEFARINFPKDGVNMANPKAI